jgi:hypothetical protein
MPAWYEEGRRPSFVMDEIVYDNDPATFYFGNMPAIDVLKLSENEGASFDGKLSLLFAGKFTLQPPPLHRIFLTRTWRRSFWRSPQHLQDHRRDPRYTYRPYQHHRER